MYVLKLVSSYIYTNMYGTLCRLDEMYTPMHIPIDIYICIERDGERDMYIYIYVSIYPMPVANPPPCPSR